MSKGIGIIIVILVHSMIPMINPVTTHLSSFAIALFFILAGLTYNGEKHRNNLRRFMSSRARQFMIPYFALYIIIMLIFLPLSSNVDTYLTPDQLLFWFLYGAGPPNQSTHLWFLPVLYFGLVLFVLIDRVVYRAPLESRLSLVILLPVLAIAIRDWFTPILVPWHLSSILLATTFCIIGNEMRRWRGLRSWRSESTVRDIAIFCIALVVLLVVSEMNGFVDLAVDRYGINAWLYMVTGTVGTILVFSLSSLLERSRRAVRAILTLGENSQTIYEIHPIFFYLVPSALFLVGWTNTDIGAAFNLFWPVRLILGLLLSLPFAIYLVPRSRALRLIFTGKSE